MLKEQATNYSKQVKELWAKAWGTMVEKSGVSVIEDDENTKLAFDLLLKCNNLIVSSCEMMEAQAEAMDQINEKLDVLTKDSKKGGVA